jgi:hypothetical protein
MISLARCQYNADRFLGLALYFSSFQKLINKDINLSEVVHLKGGGFYFKKEQPNEEELKENFKTMPWVTNSNENIESQFLDWVTGPLKMKISTADIAKITFLC